MSLKSNEKSNALRTNGNEFYSKRKFFDSMLMYNKSLCLAEPGSENVGLAYANRSAVYLESKLYEQCLKNIALAKANNYPERNLEILNKREEKCKNLLSASKENSYRFFKLSHTANKKLPFIDESLELKTNERFGRHVVTNRPLKVGEIVSIEMPFCSVLLSESKLHEIPDSNIYQRCSNCLKENVLDLMPCSTCCKAMFCSIECHQTSLRRYHRFECPIIDQLLKSGSVHMILRLFFIALSTFNGSVEKLEEFSNQTNASSSTVFDFDLRMQNVESDKNRLLALMSLVRSQKVFALHQHEEILKNHPALKLMWAEHQVFIRSFLLSQCQISDLNFHGIFGSAQKFEGQNSLTTFSHLQQTIGSGSLLFTSMINHSCANNILRICFEGKVCVVVCRPIPKGSQLFDCYKFNFMKQPKACRQAQLLTEFGFKCDCEACIENYATPPALPFKDIKLLKIAKKADDDILTVPQSQAMKKFDDCCELLEKNYHNYPSIELCLLQKCIATCLLRFAQPSVLFC